MINSIEMRRIFSRLFIAAVFISIGLHAVSQDVSDSLKSANEIIDSLRRIGVIYGDAHKKPEIVLTTGQAIHILEHRIQPQFWHKSDDPLRKALTQLVFQASNPPYDSSEVYLKRFPFDSLKISWDKFYIWEPQRFKIPVRETLRSVA